MSWLNGLVTRSYPLSEAGTGALFNMNWQSATGKRVTVEQGLHVAAVFRGVQIISSAIGGMPFKVYRHKDASEVESDTVLNPASEQEEWSTSMERWQMVTAHMVLWGEAFLLKIRNASGRILALEPIHPMRVALELTEIPGRLTVKKFIVDGKFHLTTYEIMHLKTFSVDGLHGLGPVAQAREVAALALTAEEAAARLYSTGMMQSGVVQYERQLSRAQANTAKEHWRRTMAGVTHAHEVAILDNGARFSPLSMPPADAQFLEARKFQVTEIARMLGLPAWMLNDQEKSTSWGTGMEQMFTSFVMLTLKPYSQVIEQRVTKECLPRTQYAEFKFEGILRGDSSTRAAFYASAIQSGWMVPNEVRAMENMQPVYWGDEPYLPFNQSASSQSDVDGSGDAKDLDADSIDEDEEPVDDEEDDDEAKKKAKAAKAKKVAKAKGKKVTGDAQK